MPKFNNKPTHPINWDVGYRLGAAIQQYKLQYINDSNIAGQSASKRPHTRKAHWHHYRTGKDREKLICKWLPPIAVNWNWENKADMPTVIHKVKKEK